MDHKMKPEEELAEIREVFASFFTKHQFKLKSSNIQEMIFENDYSELMFDFDGYGMRFGIMSPPVIIYLNKANKTRYSIKSLVGKFHHIDFQLLFDDLWRTQGFGYYETWLKIIVEYVEDIISDGTFSWVKDFNQKDEH
jgi:hypothetical protein